MLGFLLYIKYGIFSSVPLELFVEHILAEVWREKITDQLYKRGQINLKLEQKDA